MDRYRDILIDFLESVIEWVEPDSSAPSGNDEDVDWDEACEVGAEKVLCKYFLCFADFFFLFSSFIQFFFCIQKIIAHKLMNENENRYKIKVYCNNRM